MIHLPTKSAPVGWNTCNCNCAYAQSNVHVWLTNFDFGFTETAVNIGYSCHLLTDDLIDVFVVDGTTHDEVEKQLLKFKESVKIVNTFHIPGEWAPYDCRQSSEK